MIGDILYMEIALPARFRGDVDSSSTFNTYARVRYIELHGRQQIVRLQFLQSTPMPTRPEPLLANAKF